MGKSDWLLLRLAAFQTKTVDKTITFRKGNDLTQNLCIQMADGEQLKCLSK